MDRRMDRRTDRSKPICPLNFFEVGGIITSKSATYRLPLCYIKKPVRITIYLGVENIIKLKFTTNFDRFAILNVLHCLIKNCVL